MNNILDKSDKKKIIFKSLFYVIVVAVTVILDQITKKLVVDKLRPIYDYPLIKDVIHFTYVENKGAAFGMLRDNRWVFMVASCVAIVVLVAVAVLYSKKLGIVADTGIAFIIGGGIGNMIDRIAIGYVIDFINVELIDFAVFNIADSFVCIGVALLFVHILFIEDGGVIALKKKGGSDDSAEEFDAAADDNVESVNKVSSNIHIKTTNVGNSAPSVGNKKSGSPPTGRIIRAGSVPSVQHTDNIGSANSSRAARGATAALRAGRENTEHHTTDNGDNNK